MRGSSRGVMRNKTCALCRAASAARPPSPSGGGGRALDWMDDSDSHGASHLDRCRAAASPSPHGAAGPPRQRCRVLATIATKVLVGSTAAPRSVCERRRRVGRSTRASPADRGLASGRLDAYSRHRARSTRPRCPDPRARHGGRRRGSRAAAGTRRADARRRRRHTAERGRRHAGDRLRRLPSLGQHRRVDVEGPREDVRRAAGGDRCQGPGARGGSAGASTGDRREGRARRHVAAHLRRGRGREALPGARGLSRDVGRRRSDVDATRPRQRGREEGPRGSARPARGPRRDGARRLARPAAAREGRTGSLVRESRRGEGGAQRAGGRGRVRVLRARARPRRGRESSPRVARRGRQGQPRALRHPLDRRRAYVPKPTRINRVDTKEDT